MLRFDFGNDIYPKRLPCLPCLSCRRIYTCIEDLKTVSSSTFCSDSSLCIMRSSQSTTYAYLRYNCHNQWRRQMRGWTDTKIPYTLIRSGRNHSTHTSPRLLLAWRRNSDRDDMARRHTHAATCQQFPSSVPKVLDKLNLCRPQVRVTLPLNVQQSTLHILNS